MMIKEEEFIIKVKRGNDIYYKLFIRDVMVFNVMLMY